MTEKLFTGTLNKNQNKKYTGMVDSTETELNIHKQKLKTTDFFLTARSTIFQSFLDGATVSCVLSSTLETLMCLAQGNYTLVRRSWGSNPGPLAPESEALPLSHRGPTTETGTNKTLQGQPQQKYRLGMVSYKLSRVVRKPVFGVSDQVRHKPGCTATENR